MIDMTSIVKEKIIFLNFSYVFLVFMEEIHMEETLYKYNQYDNAEIYKIADLFSELYERTDGFIKIMSGNNRKGYFYSRETLCDKVKLEAILNSRRFSLDNIYASMATYKTMKYATMDNILTVNALAIDVDYTLYQGQENVTSQEAMRALELAILDGFPAPTYIEYSRNMRLVYILDQPYIIPADKKKAESCRTFLKRVGKCLSDKLNEHTELIHFKAEPQRLTSFIRIPFSLNKRTQGHYDYDRELYVIDSVDRYEVNIISYGEKWDIQKLSELILPPLFDGYDEWKQRNKGKKPSKIIPIKPQGVMDKRLGELEELQRRGYDKGYREKMCYFYWITAIQAGQTDVEAAESVKEFNANFKIPLDEHRLLTDCKPSRYINSRTGKQCEGWERHFKDMTTREQLGLGTAEPDLFGGKGMTTNERSKKYYNKKIAGNTKQKQIEEQMQQAQKLRREGKTWKEVASDMGISERTARRLGERIRKMKV